MRVTVPGFKTSLFFRTCISIVLVVGQLAIIPKASADGLEPCRAKAYDWQSTSTGFPVRNERLFSLSKPKILVIPFQLQDSPDYVFTAQMNQNYEEAARQINLLSNGKSKPEFVMAPTIMTDFTQSDMRNLRANQNIGNQTRDESISTWGFVRSFVSKYDGGLDFTGMDGIILEGSMLSGGIGEAMTYMRNYDRYFRPLSTNEGEILNAVLMDSHRGSNTIAHEVMHLYGLPDLYGSVTGPGRLSMMATSSLNLLSYEKWILGWLPDSDVQCLGTISETVIREIKLDYSKVNQIAVFRDSSDGVFVVETTKVNNTRYLAFFGVQLDGRPPITLFQEWSSIQSGGVEIDDYTVMGIQLRSPKFTLLVANLDSSAITLHLAPTSQVTSREYKDLVSKSAEARGNIVKEIERRFAAEAKAEAEKAAADLKVRLDAEAKAASDQLAPTKAAARKKLTITCQKGKAIRKVTAVKPKCPAGFKKR